MRALPIAQFLLCAALLAEDATQAAKDPYRLQPDHERTPYSAAEIRAGCPAGRVSIYRVEGVDGERALQVFHFRTNDESGADFELAVLSPDGQRELSVTKGRSTWVEFQAHGSHPKDRTTRSDARIETPAGTFDCWRYLVVERQKDKNVERRMFFAKHLPGPPVRLTVHIDGKLTFDMMLVEHKDGTEAAMLALMGFKGVAGAPEAQKLKYAADFAALEEKEGTEEDYVKARVLAAETPSVFKALDKDADGSLTPAECAHLADEEKVATLLRRLDHSADGSVSREEYERAVALWSR